jgi:hypothetical protein
MERDEMSENKIFVFDDEKKLGNEYVRILRESKDVAKSFKVERFENKEFFSELNILKKRQKNLRDGHNWKEFDHLILDDASILIIDYDLFKLSDQASFLTGEIVSYYVRCFSKCRYIIGLNQYGHNNFDLSLKGHPESYADLDIGSDQLFNPGLWGGKKIDFRPWFWPNIPNYLASLQKKIESLEPNLKKPICNFLGIPKEIIGIIPPSVSEFIGGNPQQTTFKAFLTDSKNGLGEKDNFFDKIDTEIISLIAISRISKWLELLVLPGQNILIDTPHLVHRYPSLLKGSHSNVKSWNETAKLSTSENLGIDHERIEKYRFKKENWLSRPAWFLNGITNCQSIKEVSDPWKRESVPYVFCEDSSSFYKKEECKEFLAELESPYTRRYVKKFDKVEYTPKVRFSL